MLALIPFVVLCVLVAVAILAAFAAWQRRDKRAGKPWSAETAAKIYISTIATFLVGALGLAATPLVAIDASESPDPVVSETTQGEDGPSDASTVSSDPSASPTADADISGEITLAEDHGVDLDTTDRVLLPTDGTPGLDVALSGSPGLYTPAGEAIVRATSQPTEESCAHSSDIDHYYDIGQGQWFCLITSEGTTSYFQVTDVTEKSSGTEATISYYVFDQPPTPDDDPTATVTGDVTLSEDHGVDLDTTDRVLLPTDDTPGLDIALNGSPALYTPEGTRLVRATTKPNRERCQELSGTDYYYDIAREQWFCFTTSEGTTGYLQVTDVTEKSSGTEATVAYYVLGEAQITPGDDDMDVSGDITLTEDYGVDLDTTDRVLLPTDDTPGLDIALNGSPALYTPEGTRLVRATTKPNRERCEGLSGSSYYHDFGEDQWFCLATSDGATGHLQVTQVTDRTDSVAVTVTYALYR